MAVNYGKKFEKIFEQDWRNSFPDSFIYRLPDQQSGYYGSSTNPCDYICYMNSGLYLIELKSHLGGTFPLSAFRQFKKMQELKQKFPTTTALHFGLIIWFRDFDKVVYCPLSTVEKLINDGKKSISIKYLTTKEYEIVEIPSVKKRVFMESYYNLVVNELK